MLFLGIVFCFRKKMNMFSFIEFSHVFDRLFQQTVNSSIIEKKNVVNWFCLQRPRPRTRNNPLTSMARGMKPFVPQMNRGEPGFADSFAALNLANSSNKVYLFSWCSHRHFNCGERFQFVFLDNSYLLNTTFIISDQNTEIQFGRHFQQALFVFRHLIMFWCWKIEGTV